VVETLRLRAGAGGERISKTCELRFVDQTGRYILQQLVKVKYRQAPTREEWRNVPLEKKL
jgi:hypothetical protein